MYTLSVKRNEIIGALDTLYKIPRMLLSAQRLKAPKNSNAFGKKEFCNRQYIDYVLVTENAVPLDLSGLEIGSFGVLKLDWCYLQLPKRMWYF